MTSSPWNDRDAQGLPGQLPWLSKEKVTVPDRVSHYVHRPRLLDRILPTTRRATVLLSPGGFGKTVLLAESCRGLKDVGVVVAWLTLDARDARETLDAYLPFAFQTAGLDVLGAVGGQDGGGASLEHRTALLARAVEQHGAPCVLVLDELEQLVDPASLALLNQLLNQGPPNLHLAIACREIPPLFDVAAQVFAGRAEMLTADDLRFSEQDIARFFGPGVARRDIASLSEESRGWAIAVRILRNERRGGADATAEDVRRAADSWVESRLWRGLSRSDRDLLLDVGLFERIEAGLVNEVLETPDAKRRVQAIPALDGLLDSVGGADADAIRLHPLIREHCARRRASETPDRFRRIHGRISRALARRGETVDALRHAHEAGDVALVGSIMDGVGGVSLWHREGLVRLQAADRFVTREVMDRFPRTALAHCIVLLLTGRLDEARRMYRSLNAKRPGVAGDAIDEDFDHNVDDAVVHGMLCLYGCERLGSASMEAIVAERERFTEMDEVDPFIRAGFEHGLGIAHNLRAEFDRAGERADRAERCLPDSPYLGALVDLVRGQVAMARGRTVAATDCYARSLAAARASFLRDPGVAAIGETLMSELNLERNRIAGVRNGHRFPKALLTTGTPLATYAAAAGVALDLTLERDGIDAALAAVEAMLDHARTADLPAVVRYLTAERVSLLVIKGRIGDATRAWRDDGLPEETWECLDLKGQSWRELEAIACARLRLQIASGRFEAGRAFLFEATSVTAERELCRTRMRMLALGIALACEAGSPAEAERHLVQFVRLFDTSDYVRPLVRERRSCWPAIEGLLADRAGSPESGAAERLLDMLRGSEQPAPPSLSPRELAVLRRLEASSDNEIAAALQLTKAGVRYHVGNLFAKLGVRDRWNAVRRAEQLGLLP